MPMDHFVVEFRDRAGNDNPSFLHHGKAVGRLALMVLTAGKDAKLMEQPVKVQIDE